MSTQKDIAEHLDLSERHVRKMVKDGVLPPSSPRGYNLDASRVAYIRHLRGVASGQTRYSVDAPAMDEESGEDANSDYRALLEQEKWREKKRENDIADGLVAPYAILTDALQKVGVQIVANMEALPLEMKRANPKLTGHDIMTVKKSIHKCCEAVSEIQLADE